VRFLALEGGVGRLEDDGSVAVLQVPGSLSEYLIAGGRLEDLGSASAVDRRELAGVALALPIGPGASVWGIGLNYRSKQIATGRSLPDRPVLFLKSPSSVAEPGAPIRIPASAPDCVDYEGEIAVLLGEPLFESSPEVAARAVRAVAATNDVTARDVMRETGNPSLAKSYPGFAQLGSAVLDPESVGGIEQLTLTTTVNGEVRQHDRGDGMILPVPELLSLLSLHVCLRSGDVVLTGTPAGTGDETKCYLGAGDLVEVEIAGLPALASAVIDSRDP